MRIPFQIGDPAPWFKLRATTGKPFHFDTAAGRHIVLCFFGSAHQSSAKAILADMTQRLRPYFDDQTFSFFGVSTDPEDEAQSRVTPMPPGIRYFWDFEREVSLLYGAASSREHTDNKGFTLVLDPFLRVIAAADHEDVARHGNVIKSAMDRVKSGLIQSTSHAPVLILPRVFSPELCSTLIGLYETHGGVDSGYMRQVNDKTVATINHDFKHRADFSFDTQPEFEAMRQRIGQALLRRLIPEIQKVFQFEVTHIERYVVSCYEAGKGHFRPHRDNTTRGTAHRRFACTLNLNAGEYEGGDLRFPEFGTATYRAPTGGAVIFSCSLLHEATPVTQGKRYAFLPFFYDGAGAVLRDKNRQFIE